MRSIAQAMHLKLWQRAGKQCIVCQRVLAHRVNASVGYQPVDISLFSGQTYKILLA